MCEEEFYNNKDLLGQVVSQTLNYCKTITKCYVNFYIKTIMKIQKNTRKKLPRLS